MINELTTAQLATDDMVRLANDLDFEMSLDLTSAMLVRKTIAAAHVITYVDGKLTATPAPLTVTAEAQSRLEGAANPPLTYRLDGTLFNNDTLQGGLATEATIASLPGAYPITRVRSASPPITSSPIGARC